MYVLVTQHPVCVALMHTCTACVVWGALVAVHAGLLCQLDNLSQDRVDVGEKITGNRSLDRRCTAPCVDC